jgi:hypothetical protein
MKPRDLIGIPTVDAYVAFPTNSVVQSEGGLFFHARELFLEKLKRHQKKVRKKNNSKVEIFKRTSLLKIKILGFEIDYQNRFVSITPRLKFSEFLRKRL